MELIDKKNEYDIKNVIPKRFSDKIYNSIVKIKLNNGMNAIGFFMKMKVKNKTMTFLFTSSNIISDIDIKNKIIINIFYGEKDKEEERNIRLDENIRFIKTFSNEVDMKLIEIIENDNISEDKFLEPELNYENGFDKYEKRNIYLAGHPRNSNFNEISFSSGRIKKISDNKFEFSLDINIGSTSSPICNSNCEVIGIYMSENRNENINYGTFIVKIIETLNNESIINNNTNNYIIGEIYVSQSDINKDIRIINSFEEYKRGKPDVEGDYKNENEKELQQNCEIKINNISIKFSYFYKFAVNGKYRIGYYFKNNISNTNFLFYDCTLLTSLDLSKFNAQKVTNMRAMFGSCKSLINLDLSNFSTQNVTNMRCMFGECISLKYINLSNFNTKNVNNMAGIFQGCTSFII